MQTQEGNVEFLFSKESKPVAEQFQNCCIHLGIDILLLVLLRNQSRRHNGESKLKPLMAQTNLHSCVDFVSFDSHTEGKSFHLNEVRSRCRSHNTEYQVYTTHVTDVMANVLLVSVSAFSCVYIVM